MGLLIISSSTEGDDLGSGKLLSKVTLRDSSILIVFLLSGIKDTGFVVSEVRVLVQGSSMVKRWLLSGFAKVMSLNTVFHSV
ncbi:hypothetical protein Tco_0874793 [Tanacetum coccineum]|uniref:Uncharacterized protein n=1 Tax=Tanacetum coccineum TaxID=301880 RepID=A0ABQ5BQG5_9ASTR